MLNPRSPFSAIVPAYNEEKTVGRVVRALMVSGAFRDVIVVSDGSKDHTAGEARRAGASIVLASRKNAGKGMALRKGAKLAKTKYLFFCDADLVGLQYEHIHALIGPVLRREADMCVGFKDRGPFWTWLTFRLPHISGQRALVRGIFDRIPDRSIAGYRVELALNASCRALGCRVAMRRLHGLHFRRKITKLGFWQGIRQYMRMGWELSMGLLLTSVKRG
ncbi:MAG: glycosyltransferase family 2 protein [Patescibacteria group bacterium]